MIRAISFPQTTYKNNIVKKQQYFGNQTDNKQEAKKKQNSAIGIATLITALALTDIVAEQIIDKRSDKTFDKINSDLNKSIKELEDVHLDLPKLDEEIIPNAVKTTEKLAKEAVQTIK